MSDEDSTQAWRPDDESATRAWRPADTPPHGTSASDPTGPAVRPPTRAWVPAPNVPDPTVAQLAGCRALLRTFSSGGGVPPPLRDARLRLGLPETG